MRSDHLILDQDLNHPASISRYHGIEKLRVIQILVKDQMIRSHWIWGAFKMPGSVLHELHVLWLQRDRQDEYFGTLVNAWISEGGLALGVRAGESYVDVGTLNGYRQ